MIIKKILILILFVCLINIVGCGGSGSSNSQWDVYHIFSDDLIQPAEDTTNLNDLKDTTIYFTKNLDEKKALKNWDEEAKFKFVSSKSFNEETSNDEEKNDNEIINKQSIGEMENSENSEEIIDSNENNTEVIKVTDDETEEGNLSFGNHKVNISSRKYILEMFGKDNLADLDGLTYHIYGKGYKSDNGLLYISITDKQQINN